MNRHTVEGVFSALADVEVLRDIQGRAYDPGDLACTWLPQMWDEDAPPRDRRHAQWLCENECPAFKACHTRREQLQTKAEGTWAGVTIRRAREPDRTDPDIQHWAESFGLPIPTPKPKHGRKGGGR